MRYAVLFFVMVLIGCAEPKESKPTVSVVCAPLVKMVEQIVGDKVTVKVMIPHNQDIHTYEPTPAQFAKILEADIFLLLNIPEERKITAVLKDTSKKMVQIDGGIVRLPMHSEDTHDHAHDHDHDHDHSDGEILDPHIWLSLPNFILLTQNATAALIQQYPEFAREFEQNSQAYVAKLSAANQRIETLLAPHKGKAFYVFHPSFNYFAHDYNLTQMSIQVEGKSPTIKQLEDSLQSAKEAKIKVIFANESFNSELPQRAGDLLDIEVMYLDTMPQNIDVELEKIAEKLVATWQ